MAACSQQGQQPATDGGTNRFTPVVGPLAPVVGPLASVAGPLASVAERRRTAALAGHLGDLGAARAAAIDECSDVRSVGFGALARLGRFDAAVLRRALADPDPEVRRRGCELAGELAGRGRRWRQPAVSHIVDTLADLDPLVAESAAWAVGEMGATVPAGAVEALATMAGSHRDARCREAAVAALGALGHAAGLGAVLGALADKPPVRRRAAVALAAFDAPEADAALRRCLADRDWQVRQVAEVLLDQPPSD